LIGCANDSPYIGNISNESDGSEDFDIPYEIIENIVLLKEIGNLKVYNLSGQIERSLSNTEQIDLNSIPNGVYILVIEFNNQELITEKYVKF